MVKIFLAICFLAISFLGGQNIVQVKLKNGTTINGEFIGTYMEHVHLLTGENINSFKCEDIQSVTKSHIYSFDYDCNKNTVSADILFPPQLNPMTGEWETIIPDVFDPKKRKVLAKEKEKLARQEKRSSKDKKPQKKPKEKLNFNIEKNLKDQLEKTKNNFQKAINTSVKPAISKEQLEKTKSSFQEMINPKIKSAISGSFYEDAKEEPSQNKTQTNEKGFSSPSSTHSVSTPQKEIKEKLTTYYYEDGAISLSEDEIRRFIKKEVRKELRKALPYEIRKHKEQNQNKLFQNILLGCGAWFLFMIMLS
ncbi:MAG: hypothetical protein CMF99_04375 [Candidatus Marinimicrobia bacterium]|nr:hypothetical protein [Candidatus Neomarinimicrobiota bacterium]